MLSRFFNDGRSRLRVLFLTFLYLRRRYHHCPPKAGAIFKDFPVFTVSMREAHHNNVSLERLNVTIWSHLEHCFVAGVFRYFRPDCCNVYLVGYGILLSSNANSILCAGLSMDERFREQAVEAARQALQFFRESNPQWTGDIVPVDKLATWLGFEVTTFGPDDHPKGTYGFLEPGENLIWLYRKLSGGMRRFTLAHEIGHAILHRHTEQHAPLRFARPAEALDPEVSS